MTLVKCPQCGFQFDTSYGRVMACGDCPSATMGNCGYAKCPRCQHEFPINEMAESSKQFGRRIA
ncbi:MAG: hypothetical protein ACFFBR_07470 [Promethearchaeota archaeon]